LILLAITLGAKALKTAMDWTIFGTADDVLGAIVGVLKWVFIMSIVFWLLEEGELSLPNSFTKDTVIFPYLILIGPWVIDGIGALTPLTEDLIKSIKEYI
jgi:membrane protein required for colicin V production